MAQSYLTYHEVVHDVPIKVHVVFSRFMPELSQHRADMSNITSDTRACLKDCLRKAGVDPDDWAKFFFYYHQREFAIGIQLYPNDPDILTLQEQQMLGLK
jgi:hypothetical protein